MDDDRTRPLEFEAWVLRLKAAYDAGYYCTESAEGQQTRFPWQDRTCGDCPFWAHSSCLVRQARRGSRDATCRYFDAWNHAEAESIIQYLKITPARGPWTYGEDQAA